MKFYQRFLPDAVTIASTTIALLLTLWLQPFFLKSDVGGFFYLAIIVTSWCGGWRSGFVAIVLSTLAINYFLTSPQYQFGIEGLQTLFQLTIFFLIACLINLLTSRFRDRKQQIEQLSKQLAEENINLLRTAPSAAQMGMWNWDITTEQVKWSVDHELLFGLTPGTFDGRYESFLACLHPEDKEIIHQALQQAIENKSLYQVEYRVIWPDGSIHWIEARGHTFYNQAGEPIQMTGTATAIDQRKQAEIALRESQIQLKRQLAEIEAIYQSAPIGLNVLDTELRFVRINQRLAEINGLSVEAHIGRSIRELLPDLADKAEQVLRSILETGEALLNIEIVGETPAQPGLQRIWLESFLPLKDGDQIIGISTVCEEITDRKQMAMALQQLNVELEQRITERTAKLTETTDQLLKTFTALQESEERRRLALDLTHIGFWDMQLPSEYLVWNDIHFTLVGLDPFTIKPTRELWRSFVHPDDLGWVEQTFSESIENHTDFAAEHRVIHPDGSVHWLMSRAKAVYDELGQPVRVLGILLDISDRKQVEEALRQSEAKFRFLSEGSPVGIFMTNTQGDYIYTNPRFQGICGCTFDETLGNGWIQFIHPEDREEVTAEWAKVSSQRQEYSAEVRYIRKDGIIRFGRVLSAPIFSVADEFVGYVGTVEDITDSRSIEIMKKEFISIVSHELRTPLAAIRGSLGLLASGVLKNKPETSQQMLDIAVHDTERLVRLVNDILDLERLESQKVKLNQQWCDGLKLMRQSVETLQSLATQSNITLFVEPTSVQVWGDSDRITQTLVNLISNAIKFSPPETKVTLSIQDQTDQVLFEVKDQGRGIPADKLQKIFGRFQQIDASDSRQKGGTGLGLTICKSIVQQHKGKIWVESIVGEGSTFYFTLPKYLD